MPHTTFEYNQPQSIIPSSEPNMPVRVVLADDHPIIRQSIRAHLAATSDIEVVAEAANGNEAIELVERFKPDVLLLDMEMPELNGVEVTRKLKAAQAAVHILAFSAHDDWEFITGTLSDGAAGYLTKDEPMSEVIAAIRGIATGQQGWLSRKIKEQMMMKYRGKEVQGVKITPREAQVCSLIQQCKTNQQIALQLQLSEKTVEKYLDTVFRKFNIMSRVQLAVLMVRANR
jgi:DNA-binding NarL/FixJ family response regulator